MNTFSTVVVIIISAYVAFLQVMRIIYAVFKPKFLSADRFGMPKTWLMMIAYYVVALYFLVMMIIEKIQKLQS